MPNVIDYFSIEVDIDQKSLRFQYEQLLEEKEDIHQRYSDIRTSWFKYMLFKQHLIVILVHMGGKVLIVYCYFDYSVQSVRSYPWERSY